MSTLRVNNITARTGSSAINVAKLATNAGRYTRQIVTQTNSTTYNFTTSWALGPTFDAITGFQAGSLVRMFYHFPMRNDSTAWGGGYIEPQVSINGGAWQSLGSCGYDASVMNSGSPAIGTFNNSLLLDLGGASDFSVQFRFYCRSYDGTVTLNGSHDVNTVSGTATIMPGNNGLQHWAHIIVEELATLV